MERIRETECQYDIFCYQSSAYQLCEYLLQNCYKFCFKQGFGFSTILKSTSKNTDLKMVETLKTLVQNKICKSFFDKTYYKLKQDVFIWQCGSYQVVKKVMRILFSGLILTKFYIQFYIQTILWHWRWCYNTEQHSNVMPTVFILWGIAISFQHFIRRNRSTLFLKKVWQIFVLCSLVSCNIYFTLFDNSQYYK